MFWRLLPNRLEFFEEWHYWLLESYGIDLEYLYPEEVLDYERLKSLHYENDPEFKKWKDAKQKSAIKAIKKKKTNDYKERAERRRLKEVS